MSGRDKYDKVESKIEKTMSPYIKVKIPMPEGVDKDAFLKLERNQDFIRLLTNQAKIWLTKDTTSRDATRYDK
jgi:hypothetical protein